MIDPLQKLGLTSDERELVEHVSLGYELRLNFRTPDGEYGDLDIMWPFDHLDCGWQHIEDAKAVALQFGADLGVEAYTPAPRKKEGTQ